MTSGESSAPVLAARDVCLDAAAIAEIYLRRVEQPRSAWTHEIDLRPFHETF